MAEPPNPPPPDDDEPRASFTDDDRDFPMPHENRSWKTGRKRKVSVLRVDPDTLPKSKSEPELPPEPPETTPAPSEQTDVEKATDSANAALTERLEQWPAVQKAIADEKEQNTPVGYKYIEIGSADKNENDTDWRYNERAAPRAYQTAFDELRAAAIARAEEEARQEVIKRYREEEKAKSDSTDASGQAELQHQREKMLGREESQPRSTYSIFAGQRERRDLRKREELLEREEALAREKRSSTSTSPTEPPKPTERKSFWDKLWALTESNLFIGGGVGMAIAAYAFLLSGAPWFGLCLLILGWLVISLSVYRHRFFEDRSRLVQVIGNLTVCGSVGLILGVLWGLLVPAPAQIGISTPVLQPSPTATIATKSDQTEKAPTLTDLFKSDLPSLMKVTDKDTVGIQWQKGDVLHITTQVYLDFDAKTQFVGFYIPSSERTYLASLQLVNAVQDAIERLRKNQRIRAGYGDEGTTLDELVFSGRVFLYHEDFLSITEKADIIKAYKQRHYDVQFRGPEYLGDQVIAWHRLHDVK
jgi:hypothetical protein